MEDRTATDPMPGAVDSVRDGMRLFMRAHNDREEELSVYRRHLLEGMLASVSLYASSALIGAASAQAATFENKSNSSDALADTTRHIHEICVQHMAGQPVETSQQRALAAWRDALAMKVNATGPRFLRACEMEARSAGLVAMFYGDMGDSTRAVTWYDRGLAATNVPDIRAWLYSCSAWVPMFGGDGEGTVKAATKAMEIMPYANPIQEAFALNQMARGYAIQGDKQHALETLQAADGAFGRYGYYGKKSSPSLDGFTVWQHAAYGADTYSMLGEVERARAARSVLRDVPFENGMNRLIRQVGEASCLVHEGEPDGAVDLVRRTITSLSTDDSTTAVVRGKARLFVAAMPPKMAESRDVRDFSEYLAAA
jgi:tetratricopeptide (TPR) repeat protein